MEILSLFRQPCFGYSRSQQWAVPVFYFFLSFVIPPVTRGEVFYQGRGFLPEERACDTPQPLSRCGISKRSSSSTCFTSRNAAADGEGRENHFQSLLTGKGNAKASLPPVGLRDSGHRQMPRLCDGKAGQESPQETIQPWPALKIESRENNGNVLGVHSSTGKGNLIKKRSRVSAGAFTAFPIHLTSEHRRSRFEPQGGKPQQKLSPVDGRKPLPMFDNCRLGRRLGSCSSSLKLAADVLDLRLT